MKSKEALYRLIKSLEKEEYNYLKKELQRNKKESNLLLLLKVHWKAKNYIRKEIKTIAANAGFSAHLQQTENHLYDKVIYLLRSYPKQQSIHQTFITLLQDIEFFYRKKLTNECRTALNKAQLFAQKYGLYEFELSLFYWDFYLRAYFVYDLDKPDHVPDFNNYLSNTQHFEQLVQNILQERQVARDYHLNFKQLLGNEELVGYRHNVQSPYQQPRISFYYHLMQGGICFQLRDWSTAQQHYLKAKAILQNEQIIEIHTDALPNLYITLLSVYIKQRDYQSFAIIQEEAKTFIFEQLSPQQQARLLPFYYHKIHLYYLFRGQQEQLDKLQPIILDIYANLHQATNEHFISKLAYQIALHYFILQDYENTIEWINKAWAHKKSMAYAIRYATHLLEIMVHFELNNHDLLTSLSDAFYRFTKKHNLLSDFERALIRFIKKYYFLDINKPTPAKELIALHATLREVMAEKQGFVRVGSYINGYAWVYAKVNGLSFAKSLQEIE